MRIESTVRNLTPSQTVGPYLSIGLTWSDGCYAVDLDAVGGFWLRGTVFDGAGAPVPDGLIESWQADPNGRFDTPEDPRGSQAFPDFRGYGRSSTNEHGGFGIYTVKPGRVPDGEGGWQAPHLDMSVFARGMLDRVVTRVYFADEAVANAGDPVLRGLSNDGLRATLLAQPSAGGYLWDVHLQGELETVFFVL